MALQLYPETASLQIANAWTGKGDTISKMAAHIWEGKGDAHSKIAESMEKDMNKLEEEDDALKAYRRSVEFLEKFGNDSDALAGKGSVLFKMARYKEARIAYEKAVRISKSYGNQSLMPTIGLLSVAKALTGMGNVFAKMGEAKKALKAFNDARSKVENYGPALYSISLLLDSQAIPQGEKPHLTPENLEKAKSADPRYAEVWRHRGAYLIMLKYNQ